MNNVFSNNEYSGAPRGISFKEVKTALCKIEGVKELHNLRIWSLTMSKTALAVHLACGKQSVTFCF